MSILNDLYAAIDATKPIQHYATANYVPRGKMFRMGPTEFFPEVWLFHPDDFAAKRTELARHCRLVDFREWKPTEEQIEQQWQRLIEQVRS